MSTARANLLTTRGDGTIVEFSSTVAIRSPLHIARCGAHGSAAPGHDSFPSLDSLPGRRHARQRPRIARPDRTALRPQARAPDPSNFRIDIVTRARHVACQSSMHRSRTQCCHPLQNEHAKPASTFNMGRRIMAERRRHRRERRRQQRPHVYTNANNQIDAQCGEPLRAFVRALARQAARELFAAQRTRHSAEIH